MPVYLRGKIPAHPEQGPTVRRVRLALGYSLTGLAIALGLSQRWGRRHIERLQANQLAWVPYWRDAAGGRAPAWA
jgi:predicted ArsR family transcriptional regulator